MRIFISYARANKGRLLEIAQALRSHEVWFDQKLGVGTDWWREIEQQIAGAHCFLALISADSEQSEYCGRELAVARKLGKPIAPVLLDTTEIPAELRDIQTIDLSAGGLDAETTAKLLNGLFEIERQVFNPLRRATDGPKAQEMLSQLTLVSTNERKRRTYEAFLDSEITAIPLAVGELQDVDPSVVALDKVDKAYAILRRPVIVEQSAFAMRAWGGFPGAMATTFMTTVGTRGVCRMMDGFDDRFVESISVVAFTDGQIRRSFVGTLQGSLAHVPSGESHSLWHPIFVPEGFDRTLADMTEAERLSISKRRRAAVDLMRFLAATYA
jgi:non-canonical purine NTP pyrophosphatase (RdgB/HAM1 family)